MSDPTDRPWWVTALWWAAAILALLVFTAAYGWRIFGIFFG